MYCIALNDLPCVQCSICDDPDCSFPRRTAHSGTRGRGRVRVRAGVRVRTDPRRVARARTHTLARAGAPTCTPSLAPTRRTRPTPAHFLAVPRRRRCSPSPSLAARALPHTRAHAPALRKSPTTTLTLSSPPPNLASHASAASLASCTSPTFNEPLLPLTSKFPSPTSAR